MAPSKLSPAAPTVYSLTVPSGWSGDVTPSKANFADKFIPALKTYTNLTSDQTSQNFGAQITFRSVGANDGWILETAMGSKKGGTINTSGNLIAGDNANNQRYKNIISFATGILPDVPFNIQSAYVKVKQNSVVGIDPLTDRFANLIIDIKKGTFGNLALESTDFEEIANKVRAAAFKKPSINNWYTATFNAVGWSYINNLGVTQMRVYVGRHFGPFYIKNSQTDYITLFSGNSQTIANRPILVITYLMP
jgi:hypothetical protein